MLNSKESKLLNITAGLRKIIYEINPNHLYCPYKAAFERWATGVLTDEEDTAKVTLHSESTPCMLKKNNLSQSCSVKTKPTPSPTQLCSNSSKSGLEGWQTCATYHDSITPNQFYRSLLTHKRNGELPPIPNYMAMRRRQISYRTKESIRRYMPNIAKSTKQSSSMPVCSARRDREDSSCVKFLTSKRATCQMCTYSFNISDSVTDNITRYRNEYTYASLPLKHPSFKVCSQYTTPGSASNDESVDRVDTAGKPRKLRDHVTFEQNKPAHTSPVAGVINELGCEFSTNVSLSSHAKYSQVTGEHASPQGNSTTLPLIGVFDKKTTLHKHPSPRSDSNILYMPDICKTSPRNKHNSL